MKLLRQTSTPEIEALRTFLHTTKNTHEAVRARAILKCIEKQPRKAVVEFFDIHIKTLDSWITRFNRYGIAGLKGKGQGGNHHLLSSTQKGVLRQLLFVERKKPQDLGYEGRFWTIQTLAQLIKDLYGVVYKATRSYERLFIFIGFSSHKPIKVNKRRDEKARQRFIAMVKKNLQNTERQIVWCW